MKFHLNTVLSSSIKEHLIHANVAETREIMFSTRISLLPILGVICLCSATRQKILTNHGNNPLNTEFSKIVNQTLDMWHVPGVSIGVVDGDDMWAEVSETLS